MFRLLLLHFKHGFSTLSVKICRHFTKFCRKYRLKFVIFPDIMLPTMLFEDVRGKSERQLGVQSFSIFEKQTLELTNSFDLVPRCRLSTKLLGQVPLIQP